MSNNVPAKDLPLGISALSSPTLKSNITSFSSKTRKKESKYLIF